MLTKKVDIVKLCQGLSVMVSRCGKLVGNINGHNSEKEGTYSRGYRDEGIIHELKTRNFTARFKKAQHANWNLGADSVRYEEELQIMYGKRSLCFATRILGGEIKRFGADEIYQGTEEIKPESWKIDSGKMPVELITNYLKRNSKKRISKKKKSVRG